MSELKLNDITIKIRESDNFINATQICNAGGKKFKNWYHNLATKEIIKALEVYLTSIGQFNKPLIDIILTGLNKGRGSYIHPYLITHLAQWVSPSFSLHVSIWIHEWREYAQDNEVRFQKSLADIKPSELIIKERSIQKQLHKKLGGEIEVETDAGCIDLLTDSMIIEIKDVSKWKHAIGQILCYGICYPNKEKWIYLFGDTENQIIINKACEKYDIKVLYM